MNHRPDNEEGKQRYPDRVPDRRVRARSRPDHSDRRKSPRFHVDFPVQIIVGTGEYEQVIQARASDISDGGLRLENLELPYEHERLRLRFRLPEGVMPEGYDSRNYEVDGIVRANDPGRKQVGIQFAENLSVRLARTTWSYLLWGAVVACFLTVSLVLLTKYENLYYFWFDVPVFFYSISVGLYLVTRFFFASFYRPPRPAGKFPAVTVLIPTHNEEEYIERTISQVFESEYPAEKLQVIAINDGSTDGTMAAMSRSRQKYPDLVIINFEECRGKREALAAGTRMSTGEIVIYTDSDSFLQHEAITRIVDGFADPDVGAVTGHCDVENAWTNLLTKMQAVRYYIGFRVMKGAESVFDTVTCLSGPLSAYRRSVLLDVLDEWVGQTFLGTRATFGDDRSLTNLLIKRGHKLIYDSRARTTTMVPEDHLTFLRQQLRWKRSWFRESIKACFLVWKRQPLMWISYYFGFLLPIIGPAVVFRALIYIPLFQNGTPFKYLFGILLMSSMMSATYLFVKRSRLWFYGIIFCYYYMLILVWQLPYAILTFWKPQWGTRAHAVGHDKGGAA